MKLLPRIAANNVYIGRLTTPPRLNTINRYCERVSALRKSVNKCLRPVRNMRPSVPVNADNKRGSHLFKRRTYKRTAIDRKSTRLNSSHVAISYAVFCLKKKKKH